MWRRPAERLRGNDRRAFCERIRQAQRRYARLFACSPWTECELSDEGWLGLVAVPWLLNELGEGGEQQGERRNAEGNPRSGGIGLAQPPVKLVLAEDAATDPGSVIPARNPAAEFFRRFFSKVVRVSFFHRRAR